MTRINIYRSSNTWCYAAWLGGDYDHSDTLDADSEADAEAEVLTMFPGADVRRVTGRTDTLTTPS